MITHFKLGTSELTQPMSGSLVFVNPSGIETGIIRVNKDNNMATGAVAPFRRQVPKQEWYCHWLRRVCGTLSSVGDDLN